MRFSILLPLFMTVSAVSISLKCVLENPVQDLVDPPVVSPSPSPDATPKPVPVPVPNQDGEDSSRYPRGGSCASGGTFSTNEFGASICEYPASRCPVTKYFVYSEGGNGVELCCASNSECNYDPVKNYCHPDLKRCVDGSYFGCSEKAGPIFASCL